VTGTISESFRQYTRKARNLGNTKKSNIGHCTRTIEVLILKYKTLFTGEITLHVAQTICRTAATLYALEAWLVSGI